MSIVGSRVTVDTVADLLADASSDTTGFNGFRLNVRNRGSVAVYLGAAAVVTTDGFQLDPGESVSMWLDTGEALYGITASSSAVVHVLKGGA